MDAFLLGIILGLTITISFGPGAIALFKVTLEKGLMAGFIFSVGLLISDLILIIISYFGTLKIIPVGHFELLGIIAGSILIIMGVISFMNERLGSWQTKTYPGLSKNKLLIIGHGFLINIANPFSLIFWIGIVGFAGKNWGLQSQKVLVFFSGILITAFLSDILKCYLSNMLKKLLASQALSWINRGVGIIFIIIGLFIIYKSCH